VDLSKPAHLEPPTRRAAAVAALVLGALAFATVAVLQDHLWATPDWRISVPGLVATLAAAAASLARHERAYPWLFAGVGLAVAACLLGWVLMLAIVLGATALLIILFHHVM
jgi:hypothetical protein